ncbi:uncharacterized protein BX663DRAFT_350444 [Cokeromyces recurvatus]|uniref:uncharacterized protein n=1 Tax=Cokeromyces recurvatus TaxID=90255 RepID=UPI002220B003|nr:uncharacterized protein BX663DRAFT_350444 [Cokeromyces recurvatus]KAI7903955.1 hypothetical protein BX663DRAFT_350444 [Cokeromyces recurvatus]
MDLKYILCEPVSKLAAKANEQAALMQQHQKQFGVEWSNNRLYSSNQQQKQQQDWNHPLVPPLLTLHHSPKSSCSSLSTCSSTSSNNSRSNDEFIAIPNKSKSLTPLHTTSSSSQKSSRRRTASDVSLTRHHMFVYSHFNRRPRSESTSSNNTQHNNVQTRIPWTPFEDHLLQQGYDQGLSWAMISSTYLPHRSRGCCWGRYKTLQNKNMIDPNHSQLRHFRRPWKSIDFSHHHHHQHSKKSCL